MPMQFTNDENLIYFNVSPEVIIETVLQWKELLINNDINWYWGINWHRITPNFIELHYSRNFYNDKI